jgi:DNA-directed RNA polymerase subunit RPC12/RpoP
MLEVLIVASFLVWLSIWVDAYATRELGCHRCQEQHRYWILFQERRAIRCKRCDAVIYEPGEMPW